MNGPNEGPESEEERTPTQGTPSEDPFGTRWGSARRAAASEDFRMSLLASTLALIGVAPLVSHLRGSGSTPLLLVDGNNLRGATVFALSQEALASELARWAAAAELPCVLVLDHGTEQRCWPLGDFLSVTLAGPAQSADDALVRDTNWALRAGLDVAVFTSDRGLTSRVRRQKSLGTVQATIACGGAAPCPAQRR